MIDFVHLFGEVPKEVAILLIAMTPVGELRASIPIGLTAYHVSLLSTLVWSFVGNMIPAVVIIYAFTPVRMWLSARSQTAQRFFDWVHARTQRAFEGEYAVYGALGLIIFIGIPLPMTGAWTGSVAAAIFQIPKHRAVAYVACGVLLAGAIVTALTTGVVWGIKLF